MKDFFKSFFSFGVATSIEKLLSFLLLPFYTRVFGVENYGIIDLTQILVTFVSIFSLLQLETSLQRYYYQFSDLKERGKLIFNVFSIVLSLSFILTVIIFVFSNYLSLVLFDTDEYRRTIEIASLQIPLVNFSILSLIILRFQKENKKFLLAVLLKVFITVVSVYLFVEVYDMGINGVFYGAFLANLVSVTYQLIITIKYFTFSISIEILKKIFSYSLPQFPARLGSASISYANRFFMLAFVSVSAIGIYSVSLKLASSIQLLYTAFTMAWAPFMFSQFEKPNHKIIFSKVLDLLADIIFPIIILISIFSNEIIRLVTDVKFLESKYYLGGLSLYFSFFIFKEVVDIGPKKLEKTKYLTYTFLISVVVNLISLYYFIQFSDLKGVVFSMILTNIVLFYLSWFVSNRIYFIEFNIIKFSIYLMLTLISVTYFMYYDTVVWVKFVFLLIIAIFTYFNVKKDYRKLNLIKNI